MEPNIFFSVRTLTFSLLLVSTSSFGGQSLSPPSAFDSVAVIGGQNCDGGVVKDDGSLESVGRPVLPVLLMSVIGSILLIRRKL